MQSNCTKKVSHQVCHRFSKHRTIFKILSTVPCEILSYLHKYSTMCEVRWHLQLSHYCSASVKDILQSDNYDEVIHVKLGGLLSLRMTWYMLYALDNGQANRQLNRRAVLRAGKKTRFKIGF